MGTGLEVMCEVVPRSLSTALRRLQIDEDLTARINMADYRFSFHEKGKIYSPAWMAPEGWDN